ncbi:MAG: aldo/keto reductase [Janthinobacterium lividum]
MMGDIGTIILPGGRRVPALGQGTWGMGEDPDRRAEEMAALRAGIESGMTLIDTAEMYGEGATESFLGEALEGLRDRVFLVSKVYPQNAGAAKLRRACEGSLKRLKAEKLDLYLLHWRGAVPLAETVDAMEALRDSGLIDAWGVSNFDADDMEDLLEAGGDGAVTNQVLYNLTRRGPEYDLLPLMDKLSLPAMAYSPIEQGRLHGHEALEQVAERHGATGLQVALAWLLRRPDLMVIPKAGSVAHVAENRAAADLSLTEADLADLDRAFPAPTRKVALEML